MNMIRTTARLSIVTALGLTLLPAHAFDLKEAYALAQKNDATYLAAVAQKNAIDTQKKQSRAALMPTVLLAGSWIHTDTTNNLSQVETDTVPANITVSLNQPLLQMDAFTAYKQVGLNVASGALALAQARQDLITRVVQAYFTAWLSDKNARIAADQEKNTALQLAIVKRSFELGITTVIDSNEAEASYYNAKSAAVSAQSVNENARAVVEDLIGRSLSPSETFAALKEPSKLHLPNPRTQAAWVAQAKEQNYNVQTAKLAYQIADLEVKRRSQKHLPVLSLVASQAWKATNYGHINNLPTNVTTVGLNVSMPIFDGGLIDAQVLEAESLKTKSAQALRAAQIQVAQAARTAYSQATSGLATISALQAAAKSASASVKSNEIGRSLGMRINIDVLNAQQTSTQTQYNLAQAQYNTILGNVNLKSAISELGDQDVEYINNLLDKSPQTTETNTQHTDDPAKTAGTVSVSASTKRNKDKNKKNRKQTTKNTDNNSTAMTSNVTADESPKAIGAQKSKTKIIKKTLPLTRKPPSEVSF